MVKFLIQDIIPPDRSENHKHRGTARPPKSLDHQAHSGERFAQKRSSEVNSYRHKEHQHVVEVVPEETTEYPAQSVLSHPENRREVVNGTERTTKYFEEASLEATSMSKGAPIHRLHGPVTRDTQTSFLHNWLPWIFGLFGVVAMMLFAMNFFGGATITVTPKKDIFVMDKKMTALKVPMSTELPFSVMRVSLEETKEVPATGEKTVTTKASGKIIIYNKQATTQRLIKNTRFQSEAGKIYRINDSINIPKQTTVSGKVTPGSVEVTVYADEAGPDFNTQATDFTLPGLKGGALFDKVYARGKGAITGGASGTIKTVTDADMKSAKDDIRVALETKLRTKARGDLAPTQIGYDDGMIIELTEPTLSSREASSPDKAVVSAGGTLYMVTFDKELLTEAIVGLLAQAHKGESVVITNLESLAFLLPEMEGSELWERDRIDFTLTGDPILEWSIDADEIRKALYGTPKQSFKTIMRQFPMIKNAEADVNPSWKRSFPTKPEDIRIEIVREAE